MAVTLIWAQSRNCALGDAGAMPWHSPEDLAHFRAATKGHPVIMGRRTWESILAWHRLLRGRTNIVLTAESDARADAVAGGAQVAASFTEALELAEASPGGDETFVIGERPSTHRRGA